MSAPGSDDDGQIGVLVLGYLTIAMMLILVVVAASSVHLERKRLLALADATALNAADDTAEEVYLRQGITPGAGVPLTDELVRESATDYVAEAGAEFTGLQVIDPTGAPGGRAAEVTLRAEAPLPVVGWVLSGWGSTITVDVTSRAEAEVG